MGSPGLATLQWSNAVDRLAAVTGPAISHKTTALNQLARVYESTSDDAAAETCPSWPGEPITAHWSVPDPVNAEGSQAERMVAFRMAYALLERRVKLFLSLPIHKLDRIALHHEVTRIGQIGHED